MAHRLRTALRAPLRAPLRMALVAWLVALSASGPGRAAPLPAPALQARAAVLLDLASGRELYAKNQDQRLYPASTTKILTALVALRRGRPDAWVTVSPRAAATPGSSLHLRAGDRLRLIDLLYGMMLVSGNDAAEAVAEAVGGSEAAFARLMNEEAARVGARRSHFTNPSGLPDPDLYTTAHDLALIARRALQNPTLARIVDTPERTLRFAGGERRTVRNENRLLGRDGVNGVKTGYTREAGHTYVASATRGGMTLVAALLGDTKAGKYEDAQALFRWGFQSFHALDVARPGQLAGQAQVVGGDAYYVDLTLPPGATATVPVRAGEDVTASADNPEVVAAPVRAGAVLGRLRLAVDGRTAVVRPLVATRSVNVAPPPAASRVAPAPPDPGPEGAVARLLRLLGLAR